MYPDSYTRSIPSCAAHFHIFIQLASEELDKMCIIKLHLRMFNITMKFYQQTGETMPFGNFLFHLQERLF